MAGCLAEVTVTVGGIPAIPSDVPWLITLEAVLCLVGLPLPAVGPLPSSPPASFPGNRQSNIVVVCGLNMDGVSLLPIYVLYSLVQDDGVFPSLDPLGQVQVFEFVVSIEVVAVFLGYLVGLQ